MPTKDPLQGADKGGVDPLVGKVLSDRYELQKLIARGGMGKIYKATQRPLGRSVALKILDIHDDDREFRDRFFLEASLCARLSHPNTIRIYDYGTTDDGIFYIAMEFLEGVSLQRVLAKDAPLDPQRALRIMRQIGGALAEAHDCGIVHRDLKPSNVFLTPHGDSGEFVKVLDFGLVKELGKESELSRTGTVLGSPLYISPEQIQGDEIDGRADIYTFGLILYYMLTGKTAFRKGNTLSLLMQQTKARPPVFTDTNPDVMVPESLEWLVMTCLEKRPDERFRSMHELLRALKACEKELRGELAQPLALCLDTGRVVLPDGMEVSTEVRLPDEPPPSVGGDASVDPTLVTTSRTAGPLGLLMVLGGSAISIGGIALLIVLLAAVGGLSWWGINPRAEPIPGPNPTVVAPPVAKPDPTPVQSITGRVDVLVQSSPSGAEVERDGVLLGSTPLALNLLPEDEWVVVLELSGYESRDVRVSGDTPAVTVTLKPTRARTPSRPVPAKPDPVPVAPAPAAPAPAPAHVAAAPEPAPVPEPEPVVEPDFPTRPKSDTKDPFADDP